MNSKDNNNGDNPEFTFDEAAPMRLSTTVEWPEGPEEIVFWAGSTIEWMLDGPAICETLAIAVKLTQDRMRKAMDDEDNKITDDE